MSNVSHPSHYNSGKFEVIEIIEDQKLSFHLGNAIKYICRAGKKNPGAFSRSSTKALRYLQRAVEWHNAKEQGRAPVRPNDMNPISGIPLCLATGCGKTQQVGRQFCAEHGPAHVTGAIGR